MVIVCDWMCKVASKINGFEVSSLEYFWPFIIISSKTHPTTVQHERIHWMQFSECILLALSILMSFCFVMGVPTIHLWKVVLCYFSYYIIYALLYLFNRLKKMNHRNAYLNILFEREAYLHARTVDYLHERKWFAWLRGEVETIKKYS